MGIRPLRRLYNINQKIKLPGYVRLIMEKKLVSCEGMCYNNNISTFQQCPDMFNNEEQIKVSCGGGQTCYNDNMSASQKYPDII